MCLLSSFLSFFLSFSFYPRVPSMFDIEREPAVSVLSSENRTTWAKAREHMKELDTKNSESLDVIEKARAPSKASITASRPVARSRA